MSKTLDNTSAVDLNDNVPDVVTFGGDLFLLLSKASSEAEGWMKSTKAMQVSTKGCVVQVTTQQENPDGSYSTSEALTYVPGALLQEQKDDEGNVVARFLF